MYGFFFLKRGKRCLTRGKLKDIRAWFSKHLLADAYPSRGIWFKLIWLQQTTETVFNTQGSAKLHSAAAAWWMGNHAFSRSCLFSSTKRFLSTSGLVWFGHKMKSHLSLMSEKIEELVWKYVSVCHAEIVGTAFVNSRAAPTVAPSANHTKNHLTI